MTTHCVFDEPWWLDAVAPGAWQAAEVRRGGRMVARLPFVYARHGRTSFRVGMPPLTQTLGPWYHIEAQKTSRRLAQEKELAGELLAQLPPHAVFEQRFHRSVTNWLPFYWSGHKQTTRYSYVLEDLTDEERLFADLQENIRREIRKAAKALVVRTDLSLERFYEVNSLTFARQGRPVPFSAALLERIDAACASRGARRMFFAVDASERVHAVAYLVHDARCAYYITGGGDPELRTSGAHSLVLWEAIRYAAGVARTFDFEGSMLEPVERFFRSFGAIQSPYFEVTRTSEARGVLDAGKAFVRALGQYAHARRTRPPPAGQAVMGNEEAP